MCIVTIISTAFAAPASGLRRRNLSRQPDTPPRRPSPKPHSQTSHQPLSHTSRSLRRATPAASPAAAGKNNKVNKARRILVSSLSVVLAVGGLGWLGDAAMATRTENAISQQVKQEARLDTTPNVNVSGFPFLLSYANHTFSDLTVGISDITVPTFGLVRSTTVLTKVTVTNEQMSSGVLDGAKAQLIARNVGLDGVSIGHLLGITDLDVSNPYNVSPAGGNVSEAQLMGTPEGFDKPVTVQVKLRLSGPTFKMTPTELIDGPAERQEEIFKDFTLEFDTNTLPMGAQASYVFLSGGTVYFQSQERNVTVHMSDLSPIVAKPEAVPTSDS